MKFESSPLAEHQENPLADAGRWEEIVSNWSQRQDRPAPEDGKNSCYVVSVGKWTENTSRDAQLSEILGLVKAQGDHIVGHEAHQLKHKDPRTFIGSGSCKAIAERATQCLANMLVIDAELSPSQTRNLEEVTGFAICDREAVILNVFSRHARSRKARIQVEIAHLEYLRPRIRGVGLNMDQQAGSIMNGRGPGETASELLARQLDGRLAELRKAFSRLQRAGNTQRAGRAQCKRIALVGYTNAGKTTLMNGLTEAGLSAKDMPFETLDTTSRCLTRHGGDVLVSDTVGFIRRLPERLLESFESTLAEACEASLLALVIDVADPEWLLHLHTTESLLEKLKADLIPRFYIFNKVDKIVEPPTHNALRTASGGRDFMTLSGYDSAAIAELKQRLLDVVREEQLHCQIYVPYAATALMTKIYSKCLLLKSTPDDGGIRFTIKAAPWLIEQLKRDAKELEL